MGSPSEEGVGTTYEIVVRGQLSDEMVADIGAHCIAPQPGKTVIIIDVIDQSHLHGVLSWLQDRNIEIERVNPV